MLEQYVIYIWIPLLAGLGLDLLFGDPLSARHPVVLIGRLISFLERRLKNMERFRAGVLTVVIVCFVSAAVPTLFTGLIRGLFGLLSSCAGRAAACVFSSLLCWQMLAIRGLKTESMKVCNALEANDPDAARQAVSMIVGRDTQALDAEGVAKAAVETVAENTCDGVIAPMFYMALLGIPGLYLYKAVNTMDSMIGYKNEKYILYGRAAARTDDVLNFIPARISALLLLAASALNPGCDAGNAWRIFRRDRRKSSSPNAGCTESVVAGALGVRLLGPASYFGRQQEKPYIGDEHRSVEPADIRRTNRLMGKSALLFAAIVSLAVFSTAGGFLMA